MPQLPNEGLRPNQQPPIYVLDGTSILGRINPTTSEWTVTATPGLVQVALAHNATEDIITLNGGVAGQVIYGRIARDVNGVQLDFTRPLIFDNLVVPVTNAPFDGSITITHGIATTIDQSGGQYIGAGTRWGGSSPNFRAVAETNVDVAVSGQVAIVKSYGAFSLRGATGRQAEVTANGLDGSDELLAGATNDDAVLLNTSPLFEYIALRSSGTAGDKTFGFLFGTRFIPQPAAYEVG